MKHPNRGFNQRQNQHRQGYKHPVVRDRQYRQIHKSDPVMAQTLADIMWKLTFWRIW